MNYIESFEGYNVPENIKHVATNISKRFIITGLCDPMYISNVIAVESGIGDGRGNFTGNKIDNTQQVAERLQGCYGCNIQKAEIPELKQILNTGEINKTTAIDGIKSFIKNIQEEMKTCDSWRVDYLNKEVEDAQSFIKSI